MSQKNDPAFPHIIPADQSKGWQEVIHAGVTKREYFAAMALQGYISSYAVDGAGDPTALNAAQKAVEYADALLLELEQTS